MEYIPKQFFNMSNCVQLIEHDSFNIAAGFLACAIDCHAEHYREGPACKPQSGEEHIVWIGTLGKRTSIGSQDKRCSKFDEQE